MSKKVNYDLKKLTDIMEWDVVNWSQALPFWLEKTSLQLNKTSALEMGARGGGLSIFLAENCKDVTCTDLTNPEENAKPLHQTYNLSNIDYKAIDALNLAENEKELIVTKSVLGSFDEDKQNKVISNIHNSLKTGGEYWFIENLESTVVHQLARKKFVKWGNRWNYLAFNNLDNKFKQFSNLKFKTVGLLGAFGFTSSQRNLLGYIDQFVMDKITPVNMNYIVIGIATK